MSDPRRRPEPSSRTASMGRFRVEPRRVYSHPVTDEPLDMSSWQQQLYGHAPNEVPTGNASNAARAEEMDRFRFLLEELAGRMSGTLPSDIEVPSMPGRATEIMDVRQQSFEKARARALLQLLGRSGDSVPGPTSKERTFEANAGW